MLFIIALTTYAQEKEKLVQLTPEIADSICIQMVGLVDENIQPQVAIKKNLISHKVISKNATKKGIGDFINKNFKNLIDRRNIVSSSVKEQHLYQRAFDGSVLNFFYDVVLDEEYEIDINLTFSDKGKQRTLLDQINYLLNTPHELILYDKDTLNDIRDEIIEVGGKTVKELK